MCINATNNETESHKKLVLKKQPAASINEGSCRVLMKNKKAV